MEPIKSDLIIFATGFKGDQKLKDVFESPIFQDYIFGTSNKTVPLYRFVSYYETSFDLLEHSYKYTSITN